MALTLAQHMDLAYGPAEQVGYRLVPHQEHVWINENSEYPERIEYTPIGTCPLCVEAAMVDAVHVVPQPRYRRDGLAPGIMRALLEQADAFSKLPWISSPGRDDPDKG